MIEEEWLRCEKPHDMLHHPESLELVHARHHLQDKTCHPLVESTRKLRLYSCACLRMSFPRLVYPADRHALEVAERFIEQSATEQELIEAGRPCGRTASCVAHRSALIAARTAAGGLRLRDDHPAGKQHPLPDAMRCHLLRDIFGNPFRPIELDPAWRSETVVALAAAIYAERAFDRMPILADALEEAGCDHPNILTHCRDAIATHVRGCWVVDLVLGKE